MTAGRSPIPDPTEPLPAPAQVPVTSRIAAQAEERPDAVAVARGDEEWTYRGLVSASRSIAGTLFARGVGPGRVVAVGGIRSFGLVAALVGVLAAGGVVVPLDPLVPAARRRRMVAEAGADLAVVAGPESDEPWLDDATSVLEVDAETGSPRDPGEPTASVGAAVDPNGPAYVVFTSGTTGVPKAVLGGHAGLAHFVDWQRETFGVGPGDRVAHVTSLSFDVVLRELFLPLTSGATLCLPDGPFADPARAVDWFRRDGITVVHAVPSLARAWLAAAEARTALPDLRLVFFAGEPLTERLVTRWRDHLAFSGQVVNLYGPTETTLAKLAFVVPASPEPGVQPIGFPLPQTQALVLAEDGSPRGVGKAGEIVLRTPFRTLGYLDTGSAEARRFRPNPFTGDPDDVVYATGDLGRYAPDGTLEILGRLDDQLKVRGVRIDPREVELALEAHPAVVAAAVIPTLDIAGDARLGGYVVTTGTVGSADLRRFLLESVPTAAIPSSFAFLDELPLRPSGKVDREALRRLTPVAEAPAGHRLSTESGSEPLSPERLEEVESRLASIWEEILGEAPADARADFFDLGGESMAVIKLAARLEEAFGRTVTVEAIFTNPTLEEQAALLGG